jgi:uncharacterized protein (DUF111 family)
MTLGAFLDLGLEPEVLWQALQQLGLQGYTSHCAKVARQHLGGTKVDFQVSAPQPHRAYQDIVALIESANLPDEERHEPEDL